MSSTEYSQYEEDYWWAVKRREIVVRLLREYEIDIRGLEILDLGCGAGANLQFLKTFGEPVGLELDFRNAKKIFKYGKNAVNADAGTGLPFKNEKFRLVSAQDVLEHLPNPEAFLREVWRITKPGGLIVMTVPAYQFLFNPVADEGHFKRYIIKELAKEVRAAGFNIKKLTYFNTFLFPLMLLQRLVQKKFYNKKVFINKLLPKYPVLFSGFFGFVFGLEKYFLPTISFIFGGSILCICEKKY